MKKYVLLSCIAAFLGIGLYGWHLYMKANWDSHISFKQDFFKIVKKDSRGVPSVVNPDDLPENYKEDVEIVRNGDDYVWVTNENQKLTRVVKRDPVLSDGKTTDRYHELYVYKNADGTATIELHANNYDFSGCKERRDNWSGNLLLIRSLDNGDTLKSQGYVKIYHNPYQYIFCDLFY